MKKLAPVLIVVAAIVVSGCKSVTVKTAGPFSHFEGLKNFSNFTRDRDSATGCLTLLSPKIDSEIPYNQLVVSWNADAPPGTFVKVEATASGDGLQTKFYTIAEWSLDGTIFPRTSVRDQRDADGNMDTDILKLNEFANAVQIRVTLGGKNGAVPRLKFIGLSFANVKVAPAERPANHAAWGKIITTPEHSQHGYPGEAGWCSPTSTSMVLSRWADVLHRPEMDLTVPQVAHAVYDQSYAGTGNWPFNTAFAGSFPGMRAYVSRFDDLSEVEDWIAAGIPVVLSTRWDQLLPGRPPDFAGHLVVCIGFTKDGDVVINDPATRFDRGESVRRIYKRANVINSWTQSHHAVYLVYPEKAKIPANEYGHW
jgi:hypothetical protein